MCLSYKNYIGLDEKVNKVGKNISRALHTCTHCIQWVGGGGGSPNSEAAVECETDHSLPSNAKVKNVWSYTSISLCAFMVWCLIKNGDNFTFRCYLL